VLSGLGLVNQGLPQSNQLKYPRASLSTVISDRHTSNSGMTGRFIHESSRNAAYFGTFAGAEGPTPRPRATEERSMELEPLILDLYEEVVTWLRTSELLS
jgi:hypothetical protein